MFPPTVLFTPTQLEIPLPFTFLNSYVYLSVYHTLFLFGESWVAPADFVTEKLWLHDKLLLILSLSTFVSLSFLLSLTRFKFLTCKLSWCVLCHISQLYINVGQLLDLQPVMFNDHSLTDYVLFTNFYLLQKHQAWCFLIDRTWELEVCIFQVPRSRPGMQITWYLNSCVYDILYSTNFFLALESRFVSAFTKQYSVAPWLFQLFVIYMIKIFVQIFLPDKIF